MWSAYAPSTPIESHGLDVACSMYRKLIGPPSAPEQQSLPEAGVDGPGVIANRCSRNAPSASGTCRTSESAELPGLQTVHCDRENDAGWTAGRAATPGIGGGGSSSADAGP